MASNDMKAANKTYSSFISMTKVAVPIIAVITLIVIVLISE